MSLTDFDRACEDLISGVHLCIEHRLVTPGSGCARLSGAAAAVDGMAFFASMSNELAMESLKFLDPQSPDRNLFEREF